MSWGSETGPLELSILLETGATSGLQDERTVASGRGHSAQTGGGIKRSRTVTSQLALVGEEHPQASGLGGACSDGRVSRS